MSGFPGMYKIRLTVDSMRTEMIHAISARELELDRLIQEGITAALGEADLQAHIRREVDAALKEVVHRTMADLVRRVVWSSEVTTALEQTARSAVVGFLAAATKTRD